MEGIPKPTKLYIGVDVEERRLRRVMMQLSASWGFLPVSGKMIDEQCAMIFADTWERASFWEVESEAQWGSKPIVIGIGFEIGQRQIEPVIDTRTADLFRMMIYYWLGNTWMFRAIQKKQGTG